MLFELRITVTLSYTTIISVLLAGYLCVTLFVFNVFYSLTFNVHCALHVSYYFFLQCRFLFYPVCVPLCGLYSVCFVFSK